MKSTVSNRIFWTSFYTSELITNKLSREINLFVISSEVQKLVKNNLLLNET
jgi:hypothetical protein